MLSTHASLLPQNNLILCHFILSYHVLSGTLFTFVFSITAVHEAAGTCLRHALAPYISLEHMGGEYRHVT